MKIAMIGHRQIPSREGGVEIVVQEISTRMVKKGNEVTCYNRGGKNLMDNSLNSNKIKEYQGVKIKKVWTINKKGLAAMTSSFFGTLAILFSKAKIVHYHAEGPCAWMWIIRIFSRKRIIATIHGLNWKSPKWKGFGAKYIKFGEKVAVKCAHEIIVLSESMKEYFKETYNRNTIFIPNGVSKPIIRETNIIKEKFGLEKDNYILFLGRIEPVKGIHYLIDAYKKIKTDKKLVIAGGVSEVDSYYNELLEKADKNKNIIFTGFVQGDILDELYSNAYIYVLPSDAEGMPLSLLEAMSYGNCCLTSDIKECTEVIEDKGIYFKKSDTNDLLANLQNLCNNKEIVNKYKKNSQNYILNKYNWDNIVNETLKLYSNNKTTFK